MDTMAPKRARSSSPGKPRERGRPPMFGDKMLVRSLSLPESTWRNLDAQAIRESQPGARVTALDLIRRKLGLRAK